MQHTFASKEGPLEVTLVRDGEAFVLEGHKLTPHTRGRLHVRMRDGSQCLAHVAKVGDVWWIHLAGRTYRWERVEPGASKAEDEGGLVAPMPGKVLEVLVKEGDVVEAGTPLMVLEAMKMEHRIVAASDETVVSVHFGAGEQVAQGAVLLELD